MLAIETASRAGSVALLDAAGCEHVEALVGTRRHDDALMPALDRLCTQAQVAPAALQVIGVSIGPGGFTGVRIGVITAKVLAETLDCALVAVPTAEVAAASAAPGRAGERLLVCLAAKKTTVWAQLFQRGDEAWRPGEVLGAIDAARVFELGRPDRLLADAHLPRAARDEAQARGIAVEAPVYDARACLRLTLAKWAAGELISPIDLVPFYPREPEAVTKWRERAASHTSSSQHHG